MRRMLALLLTASFPAFPAWKLQSDKKPSPITGVKNVNARVIAKRGIAFLMIGCTDTKPILRVAQNFNLANGLNDALTKSRIERAIDKSQRYGFALGVRDGKYFSHFKLRFAAATEFLDSETPAGYRDGTYFLILDERLPELLPQMKTDSSVFVQLPYKTGEGIVEFPLAGLDAALSRLSEAGCRL